MNRVCFLSFLVNFVYIILIFISVSVVVLLFQVNFKIRNIALVTIAENVIFLYFILFQLTFTLFQVITCYGLMFNFNCLNNINNPDLNNV